MIEDVGAALMEARGNGRRELRQNKAFRPRNRLVAGVWRLASVRLKNRKGID